MYKAAIFDMDGLLIDSEPHWQHAEISVLTQLGIPLTKEMCFETVGLRVDEAVEYWRKRYPWRNRATEDVCGDILSELSRTLSASGKEMPGAAELVRRLHNRGIPVAIATSSHRSLVELVMQRLAIEDYVTAVSSAQDQVYGKPHPAVYLTAADKLNVTAADCVAFEDSVNGVISAKAARMYCVAVPHNDWAKDPRFVVADSVLPTLEACDDGWLAGVFG